MTEWVIGDLFADCHSKIIVIWNELKVELQSEILSEILGNYNLPWMFIEIEFLSKI